MSIEGDMPIRCPKIVIHHQAGKEYWAEQEVGDTLFPFDPNVEIKKTDYRGVMIVFTSLSPEKSYSLLISQILTSIDRIIQVKECIFDKNVEIDNLLDLIYRITKDKGWNCVNIVFKLRGAFKTKIDAKLVLEKIKEKGLIVSRSCGVALYLESLGELLMIGVTGSEKQ